MASSEPYNPYYTCLWYALFLILASFVLISASEELIRGIFSSLKSLGVENALKQIPRLERTYDFLIQNSNVARWERVVVYWAILVVTYPIALLMALLPATPYLRWYKTINETWKEPLKPVGRRFGWFLLGWALVVIVVMYWDMLVGPYRMDKNPRVLGMNALHLNDWGYFNAAIKALFLIFAHQGVHYFFYRHHWNRKVRQAMNSSGGKNAD